MNPARFTPPATSSMSSARPMISNPSTSSDHPIHPASSTKFDQLINSSERSIKGQDNCSITTLSPNLSEDLSDEDLLVKLKSAVTQERKARQDVLYLLKEVQRRQIHLKRGYSSLFMFLTQECSYSEGAAQRRILAIRLINSLGPELGQKLENDLETGSLSLATISAAQSAFSQIPQDETMTAQSKMQLLDELKGKSRNEIQRKIAEAVPSVGEKPRERRRIISADLTELRICVNHETLEKLDELRERLAHGLKDPRSYSELLDHLATMVLKRLNQWGKRDGSYLQGKDRFLEIEASPSQKQVLNTDSIKEKSYSSFTNQDPKKKNHPVSTQSKPECSENLGIRYVSTELDLLQSQELINNFVSTRIDLDQSENLTHRDISTDLDLFQKQNPTNKFISTHKDLTPSTNPLDQSKSKLNLKPGRDPNPEIHSSLSPTRSRYVSSAIRKIVLARDQHCCSYQDPLTGQICRSRFKLQLDHEIPFALGGPNTERNLRVRCQAHNLFHATEFFGTGADRALSG